MKNGADGIATGHFCRLDKTDGRVRLLRGADSNKDQTYFLYMLSQEQLRNAMFPVGHLTKAEVRQIAREHGLDTAEKKDSTGVCFIGERNFKKFLSGFLPAQPGDMVTPEDEIVGHHDGLMYYTLGQRKGLGIGGRGDGRSWFVIDKDLEHNRLIVCQGGDDSHLFTNVLHASQMTFIAGEAPAQSFECTAKVRYRQPDQRCRVEMQGDNATVVFENPQRAVTPGQSVVLYQGEECLGGGIIETSEMA